eukprot:442615_1
MSSKRKLSNTTHSNSKKKRKLNNTATTITTTTPKEMKIKLEAQLNQNKIELSDENFFKLLQAFCCNGDNDETVQNVRKQTISYLLKKTPFTSEISKNALLKINTIFGNKEESKKLERAHIGKLRYSLDKKYLNKSKLRQSHPSIKLLGCVGFFHGYQFAEISEVNKMSYISYSNGKTLRINANFSFEIGCSKKLLFDTLKKIKYIKNVNIDYEFANNIISEMVGDEIIMFKICVKGEKSDNENKWRDYGSYVHIYCNGKYVKCERDGNICAAKRICKESQLLKNYMVKWKQLYRIVEIIIDEHCNIAKEFSSIKLFKSALHFSDFFGDYPPCSMQKQFG